MFRSVANEWALFSEMLPPEAPKELVEALRKAFYSGALALFHIQVSTDLKQEAYNAVMEGLRDELEAFGQQEIEAILRTATPAVNR